MEKAGSLSLPWYYDSVMSSLSLSPVLMPTCRPIACIFCSKAECTLAVSMTVRWSYSFSFVTRLPAPRKLTKSRQAASVIWRLIARWFFGLRPRFLLTGYGWICVSKVLGMTVASLTAWSVNAGKTPFIDSRFYLLKGLGSS